MTTYRSQATRGAIGFAIIAALAGCGTTTPKSSPSATANSSPTAPTSSTTDARSAALSAYNAAIAEWVRAGTTADNHDPHLADHATDQALTNIQLSLASARSAGLHFDGTPKDDPQVKELLPPDAPSQVFIVSCMDATNWISRKADGTIANTGPNGKHRVEALVADSPFGWKVTRMLVRAAGTC